MEGEPNKTRGNCWFATITLYLASKQQRRRTKTFRGELLCDQFLNGNDINGNPLSRNLGIYSYWLTFVVTEILRMSQEWALLRKQIFTIAKFLNFLQTSNQAFRCSANRALDSLHGIGRAYPGEPLILEQTKLKVSGYSWKTNCGVKSVQSSPIAPFKNCVEAFLEQNKHTKLKRLNPGGNSRDL